MKQKLNLIILIVAVIFILFPGFYLYLTTPSLTMRIVCLAHLILLIVALIYIFVENHWKFN